MYTRSWLVSSYLCLAIGKEEEECRLDLVFKEDFFFSSLSNLLVGSRWRVLINQRGLENLASDSGREGILTIFQREQQDRLSSLVPPSSPLIETQRGAMGRPCGIGAVRTVTVAIASDWKEGKESITKPIRANNPKRKKKLLLLLLVPPQPSYAFSLVLPPPLLPIGQMKHRRRSS